MAPGLRDNDQGEGNSVQPSWLQFVDHTADVGIVVSAGSLPELFSRAAWGMFSIVTEVNAVRPAQSLRLSVMAPDREALLVKWLSELNFQHVTQHRLFCEFNVLEFQETDLKAEIGGESIDPARHEVFTEIKAVTFHGLRIEGSGGCWRAQIIFDL